MKKVITCFSLLALSAILFGCSEKKSTSSVNTDTNIEIVHEQHQGQELDHNHGNDHEHSHQLDEEQKKIYNGYFEDEQVHDRPLSNWEGDWQSIYPYLEDATLDEVFEHKAEHNEEQTFDEVKAYYNNGYKTSTDRIVIDNNFVTFFDHGHEHKGEYEYDGYEILTYAKGNRGVRYIFKHVGDEKGVPAYIQFSDHIISTQNSNHFHLYWGNDRKSLLEEVTNWPTYYPSNMDGHAIAHEMIAH
ncbi:ZinT family metal-binding protein [Paenibacillus endoradicis]|uniref:ZinT family metal-binding protein n=1 Tax=Paenibacillus endoradicis TaxID=2972487 RepID=UPI00215966BD|nr:metal-binding protein ZinT [Paenibacillus endoradicis]MCR8659742.1 metal-binding protein ZinT [Paenibacillus endoradicis]